MEANNTTGMNNIFQVSKSISDELNLIIENGLVYLPLIFLILGLVGFIGNLFTYLQAELRYNTCCIYSLCGSIIDIMNLSINLLPMYLANKYQIIIAWFVSSITCGIYYFLLVFLPHLSINFSLMAIIDRFAATSSHASPMRRLNVLKNTPWIIIFVIISSALCSLYAPILFNTSYGILCTTAEPRTTFIFYVIFIGLIQPISMFIFVLLTYRNIRQSRRRVAGMGVANQQSFRNQFIGMIITQVFVTSFFSLQWIAQLAIKQPHALLSTLMKSNRVNKTGTQQ
ncbi:hypothetical protein I4U23_019745 [Adineta vaga]|nr:hypothetical protein I4U23_019745 [Adineta vaga]